MNTNAAEKAVLKLERQLADVKRKLALARRKAGRRAAPDYELHGWGGAVRLSELFGDKSELILIHNMGRRCPYCTLWADGFNGMLAHLEDRAAFVVCSPDATEVQQVFAGSRGWKFRMVSSQNTAFQRELAFETKEGKPMPGVTAFQKDARGKLWRVASAAFGPGDDYCSLWPLLELLPKGAGGWEPKLSYAAAVAALREPAAA